MRRAALVKTFLQRIQRLVEGAYPPCCFVWFWKERDVHGCQALVEGIAGEATFGIGVKGIWRSVVSRPAVVQCLGCLFSSDIPKALRYRALKVDVHDCCAAPVVHEYRPEYS